MIFNVPLFFFPTCCHPLLLSKPIERKVQFRWKSGLYILGSSIVGKTGPACIMSMQAMISTYVRQGIMPTSRPMRSPKQHGPVPLNMEHPTIILNHHRRRPAAQWNINEFSWEHYFHILSFTPILISSHKEIELYCELHTL